MKNPTFILIVLFFASAAGAQNEISLIPKPIKSVKQASTFVLNSQTKIYDTPGVLDIADYLQTGLLRYQRCFRNDRKYH